MWLPRVVAAIRAADRPVVLTGGEAWGAPFLIEGLAARSPVAWFELGPATAGDDVAQGNELARAVNRAIGTPLLGTALPYQAQLASLRHHAADVTPLCLAVTTALADEPVLGGLVGLHERGFDVLVDLRAPLPHAAWQGAALLLGPEELRVPLHEAELLVPRAVPPHEVEGLWRSVDGRFTDLLAAAHEAAGLPRISVPSAQGALVDPADAQLVDVPLAVQALRREGELVAALELATLRAPELVDDLLRQAGPRFQEEGLLERLHLLLSAVPEEHARSERVLEWRLVAAVAVGDVAGVLEDVDAHLAVHVAPELRARRAGTLPPEEGFELARQALEARRTPLTLWQYGRLHPDQDAALEALRESVYLADDAGRPLDLVRNAGMLVARLARIGDYAQAARWARWTLDVFHRGDVHDGARRIQLVNDLAMANIMSGDMVGVRSMLEDARAAVEDNLPRLAALIRGTLAALELAEGAPEEALPLAEANYRASPRRTRALHGQFLVRVLLELGDVAGARRVADDLVATADEGRAYEWTVARLARGMVRAVEGAPGADDDLLGALLSADLAAELRLCAALHYLLAYPEEAVRLPEAATRLALEATPTALRVASGPEARFAPVWRRVAQPQATLRLNLLGDPAARLAGGTIGLPLRLAEVVAALVLDQDGVELEELGAFLVPDGMPPLSKSGMRALMTRLRKVLPVSDAPYRFEVPFTCDVLEVRAHLAAGEVRQAVALYKDGLVPRSEAPGLVEERLNLEEELRQAVLGSGDADSLFELAERLVDDLECWEAAATTLLPSDPRLTVARARVRRLRAAYGEA